MRTRARKLGVWVTSVLFWSSGQPLTVRKRRPAQPLGGKKHTKRVKVKIGMGQGLGGLG